MGKKQAFTMQSFMMIGVWGLALNAFTLPALGDTRELCQSITFEKSDYVACEIDLSHYQITVKHNTTLAPAAAIINSLVQEQEKTKTPALIVMNAGMYLMDLAPVGLYIENKVMTKKINTRRGSGNFHMLPNGVFYIAGDQAGVLETNTYVQSGVSPEFATQSGPMLVIDRKLHPRFKADGESHKIRNGVGITKSNKVIFAMSRSPVSFGTFARLFRDHFKCANALYLDGTISALYSKSSGQIGGLFPVGPLLVVSAKDKSILQ